MISKEEIKALKEFISLNEDSEINIARGFLEDIVEYFDKQSKIGGWIPCSERLPEEHKLYDITTKNEAGIHSDSAIFNPYLKRWLWDADETELVKIEVLAWKEKRQSYKP